jgi:hypothetical protein
MRTLLSPDTSWNPALLPTTTFCAQVNEFESALFQRAVLSEPVVFCQRVEDPRAWFPSPLVLDRRAFDPIATFCPPVVLFASVPLQKAVFELPVRFCASALYQTAVFHKPVVLFLIEIKVDFAYWTVSVLFN